MSRLFDPMEIRLGGVQLIEASAGTGKTHSITSLYLRLVLERRLTPEQILVVTFTEAATAELHERVRSRLRKAEKAFLQGDGGDDEFLARLIAGSRDLQADRLLLQRALLSIDQAAISTIHGFCFRVLQQHAFDSGLPFDLDLASQSDLVLREIVADYLSMAGYGHDSRLFALVFEHFNEKSWYAIGVDAVRHRHYPIQPSIDLEGLERLVRSAEELYQGAGKLWLQEKQEIRSLIAGAPGLTKPFQRLLKGGLLAQLDRYLAGPVIPSFRPPPDSEKLTPRRMADSSAGVFTRTAIDKGQVPGHDFFQAWEALVQALEQVVRFSQVYFVGSFIDYLRAEFPRRLLIEGKMSFDDLLYLLESVLLQDETGKLSESILKKFPVALIDEFQDTDPVQYRIFRDIYGSSPDSTLFFIGDPKQAIYSFRGADIYAYLQAARQRQTMIHTMTTNWRADHDMVLAVNHLFAPIPSPFFDDRIGFPEVQPASGENALAGGGTGAPLEFLTIPEGRVPLNKERLLKGEVESLIPELIAADLAALLAGEARIDGRKILPADIAVLVRTNDQAAAMKHALQKLKINAVLQSRHNVFQSAEAGQLLRLLRAAADPADERAVFSALATELLGYTADDLLGLLDNEGKYQEELEQFSRWHGLWLQKGVLHMLRNLEEERESVARLMGHEDGPRKFTNYRHLAELLEQVEQSGSSHLTAVVQWLANQISQGQAAEEFELRLESDEEAVQLVTIHRSKGLEYPVVYCPYLWSGISLLNRNKFLRFHDPADGWNGKFVLFPEAGQLEAKLGEEFAENLRLLYVAVTRAKHSCRILWAPASGYDNSPLAYVLHGAGFRGDTLSGFREWQSFIANRDHATLQDDLRKRAAAAVGWLIRDAATGPGSLDREGVGPRTLDFRKPLFPIIQSWRMSSFSQLASRKISRGLPPGAPDHDEFAGPAVAAGTGVDELPLAGFPRGPNAGNFFHQLFENISFRQTDDDLELQREIAALLGRYGYQVNGWQEKLPAILKGILAAPLDRSGLSLQDLDDRRRLTETEFFFPLAFGKAGGGFRADRLVLSFRRHPAGISPDYPESLEKLHIGSLKGFMKGFIDLVFEHQGRWHIVDYKSNYLGDRGADYAAENLQRSMAEHHYYLQYHIYTVALDRYLRCRIPDYSYDRHFGGVWYLFIRGMRPDGPPGQGVFFDRPPVGRISLLSAIFAGEAGEV